MRYSKMAVAVDSQQHHGFKLFTRSQICRLQSFAHLDSSFYEHDKTNLTHSLRQACDDADCFHRSFSTPCFSLANEGVEEEFDTKAKVDIVGGLGLPGVRALVVEVAIALASSSQPVPLPNGLGGAYLLSSRSGRKIAVAKPIDEEPLARNNPKGFGELMPGQPGMKRSVPVGETGVREVAAYLLDHDGFSRVPPTALVKIVNAGFHVRDAKSVACSPYKIASLQRFVDHDFDAGELGPIGFSVESVHRVGILDIRLLNLDRHAGNILVKKNDLLKNYAVGTAELVPIDHGLCLPEWLDDPYFEWLHWPQASVPFSESELKYISNLDPLADAEVLRTDLPSLKESSIRILVLCTVFLKAAAAAGLCLANIGEIMSREFGSQEENLSVLENLCAKAKASIKTTKYVVDDCGANNDNAESKKQHEEVKEDTAIFQFEKVSEVTSSEVIDFPALRQNSSQMGKPPKYPKFSSTRSMPMLHGAPLTTLYKENVYEDLNVSDVDSDAGTVTIYDDNTEDEYEDNNSFDEGSVGQCKRSKSNPVGNCYNSENEGISLGDMNEEEWKSFLECFEKDLVEVLDNYSNLKSPKQRWGTSCEF